MSKADLPLQPIPIAYYAGDGCKIFNDEYDLAGSEKAQKWQVSRYVLEEEGTNGRIKGCYTPQRLFLDGKWSSDWIYENKAEFEFPSATAAWHALKRAWKVETQKQLQGEVSRVDQLSDEEREEREERKQLAQRLDQLAKAISKGQWSEFSMRVPAEPQRDADLVLSRAAQLLRQSPQGGEVQS